MAEVFYREVVTGEQKERVRIKASEMTKPHAGFVPPAIALEDSDTKLARLEARLASLESKRG